MMIIYFCWVHDFVLGLGVIITSTTKKNPQQGEEEKEKSLINSPPKSDLEKCDGEWCLSGDWKLRLFCTFLKGFLLSRGGGDVIIWYYWGTQMLSGIKTLEAR